MFWYRGLRYTESTAFPIEGGSQLLAACHSDAPAGGAPALLSRTGAPLQAALRRLQAPIFFFFFLRVLGGQVSGFRV
jgi:hypothetical protein